MAADTPTHHKDKTATPEAAAAGFAPDEASQELKRAGDSMTRITGECISACSDTMAAAMASGTRTSQLMSEIGKSYMDACGVTAAAMAEIARESATCRTPADVMILQKKSLDAFGITAEAMGRLQGQIFEACSEAFQPLVARAGDVPERMFRAIAD